MASTGDRQPNGSDPEVRTAEAAALHAVLDALSDGRGRLVELVGEPGAGKTRLLTGLAEEAERRGAVVLRGRATEASSALRCQVLVDVLGRWGGAGLDEAQLAALGELLPQLALGPGPQTIPADLPPAWWLCHYYATLVQRLSLCAGRGLVLLLDDAHWLDPGTLELLEYLGQRPVAAPVAVVVSYRPRQAPAELAGTFAQGVELGTAGRVELAPLDPRRSAELAGMPVDSPALRRLHRESAGNPLYLLTLLDQAAEAPGAESADGAEAADGARAAAPPEPVEPALPVRFGARISAEFVALDEQLQQVAAAGAVLGERFDAAGVAALIDQPKERTCGLLDGLVRRDLLRTVPGTDQLAYRHPLVRRAVYAAVDACWRIEAHRKALDFLSARGVPDAELAEHVQRSGPGDGERDHLVLAAAARVALLTGDARAAATLLPEALRLLAVRGKAREAMELSAFALSVKSAARPAPELLMGCGVPLPTPALPGVPAEPAGAAVELFAALTEREREVADLAGTGRRTRQIAAELRLSPRTVDVHLTRIYRKLNISSRAALARMVVESGRAGGLAG
ncbi:AAA family ATPase [Kitasatospora sp. NPDC004745]|uniref:AAA family ATPase n=1 Tax=unclassified Kitasatospora TaxID=2633591 RepID=UPI0033CF42F5